MVEWFCTKSNMTTDRQKYAVKYIEKWLGIKFRGNIECYQTVSHFIGQHLAKAKEKNTLANLDWLFSGKPIGPQY